MRRLQYRTNNAYDSILLLEDGVVIGAWPASKIAIADFLDPGDLNDWSETYPDETDPSMYGDIVSQDDVRNIVQAARRH